MSGNSEEGGIYNFDAALAVSNCTISDNSASYDGGGIFNDSHNGGATLVVNNCTISGNWAGSGGGICNRGFDG